MKQFTLWNISPIPGLFGQQPDVHRYLSAADFFVFASRYEGLPLAVLEAMACGLPCLLSDIPPHREIADEGKAAMLVPKQPRAWARSMLALLGDPEAARALAERGQARCAQVYTAKVVARAFERLFLAEAAPGQQRDSREQTDVFFPKPDEGPAPARKRTQDGGAGIESREVPC